MIVDRDLGEVGQADELGHQRHARARRGGEGARAVPAGAGDHADRGDLVLGLHDGVARARRFPGRGGSLLQYFWKASATDDDGVIGYQAQTVAPP